MTGFADAELHAAAAARERTIRGFGAAGGFAPAVAAGAGDPERSVLDGRGGVVVLQEVADLVARKEEVVRKLATVGVLTHWEGRGHLDERMSLACEAAAVRYKGD